MTKAQYAANLNRTSRDIYERNPPKVRLGDGRIVSLPYDYFYPDPPIKVRRRQLFELQKEEAKPQLVFEPRQLTKAPSAKARPVCCLHRNYWSIDEAAHALGMSYHQIYGHCRRGDSLNFRYLTDEELA